MTIGSCTKKSRSEEPYFSRRIFWTETEIMSKELVGLIGFKGFTSAGKPASGHLQRGLVCKMIVDASV